jgi:CRP/FNR family transcriptional regulator
MKTYRTFAAGETIMWRGEALVFVASVVDGVATLSKTLEDGRTQMVGLLLPSDFIGRPGRTHIDFDVVAATQITLCCFALKPFEALINDTPHVAQRLAEIALDELDSARDWMLLLGRKTAREKIATFLEMLIRRQHIEELGLENSELSLPLTREEIADYLGLTLETVSRQLNAMKKAGILAFSDRRHFDVIDLEALRAATGDDS